jgi:trimeric autotransporter adhesin
MGNCISSPSDGTKGTELWKTDGTEAGTVMVKDINLGSSNGSPSSLTPFNGTQYFSASDGMNGKELWKTDNILHYYSSSSVIACC